MDLISALKSGKRYRLVGHPFWHEPGSINNLSFEEALMDWEIKEEPAEYWIGFKDNFICDTRTSAPCDTTKKISQCDRWIKVREVIE